MIIDVNELVSEVKETLSTILGKDISVVRGFSNRQITGIANQTALVASGIASGDITDANRDFFLEQLVELAHNFVNTLVGLVISTIEKLWNALVTVLWNAISKVIGTTLPPFKLL